MAVMTTQFSEPITLEQKTQPVPSSDKMALDLDINGTSTLDETNHDTISDAALNKSNPSPANEPATEFPEVNGAENNAAFSSHQTLLTNISDPSLESQPSPTSALDLSGLQDTNAAAEPDTLTSFDGAQLENGIVSAESAIESAVEDIAPTSTIPPIVEAPESDLRDEAQLLAPEAELQEHFPSDHDVNLSANDQALADQTAELDVDANNSGADINFDLSPTTISKPNSDPQPEMNSADQTLSQTSAQVEPDPSQMDTIMDDAPTTSPHDKVSRGREEDDDEAEPSAKRTKTEDVDVSFQEEATQNGNQDHGDDIKITEYVGKELTKIVKSAARAGPGKNFRLPVAKLWPNFAAAYREKIKNEIDLELVELRVKDQYYHTISDVKKDIQTLYTNALAFNGPGHLIEQAAMELRNNLFSKFDNIASEPVAAPKKEKKAAPKRSTPAPAPARESRGSHGAPLPTPQPTQTFALDPSSNTPLIRRDSTKLDGGRPKREIHPPKNKDLPYSVRPKSKKHAHELKFCEDTLSEIKKPKYLEFTMPFLEPVDPVALNIPNYFTVIKKPMDLDTMSTKLRNGSYTGAMDFDRDMRQILTNCYKFNPAGNPVHLQGKRLEELYKTLWDRKDQYLADRSPPAASLSAGESDEDEEDEEDVPVAEKNQDNTLAVAKDRLIEEQSKLLTLMGAKYPDQGLIQMQKEMVGVIEKRISAEEEALAKNKIKKKPAKSTKKAAPAKKPSTNSKKSGGSTTQNKRYMGTLEKEVISAGLGALPDDVSNEVLADIKKERPGIDAGDDGTLELDIDVISVPLLWKIHGLIMRYAPDVQENIQRNMAAEHNPKPQPKAAPKKKNKPMSKYEQERNIGALEKRLDAYQRQSSGSQEPVLPTVEQQDESSGDEESDSEEE